MSMQFPLCHPQRTPLPRCSFSLASFCAHIRRFPRFKQGLEIHLLSSKSTVTWACHATLSSQSTLTSHPLISFTIPPKPQGDHTKACTRPFVQRSEHPWDCFNEAYYILHASNELHRKWILKAVPAQERSCRIRTITVLCMVWVKNPYSYASNVSKDKWTSFVDLKGQVSSFFVPTHLGQISCSSPY